MKRQSSREVEHTYGLRSMAKRAKLSVQPQTNAHHQSGHDLRKSFLIKYPIVVLHDIALDLAKCVPSNPLTNFTDLNDHCILELFEVLPLIDLCAMAEVSVRLKSLAEYFFRVKYGRHFSMKQLMNNGEKITIKQARQLLRNFGHLITSMHVSRKWFTFDLPKRNVFKGQRQLLSLIKIHCIPNLITLTLTDFWLSPAVILESMPIFMRLQTLYYHRLSCYCEDVKTFCHFANILPFIFEFNGLTQQMPQLIQLV